MRCASFRHALAALLLSAVLTGAQPAMAQIAGSTTTTETSTSESTALALGWSVRHTLMGKSVFNDDGQRVGRVQDIIISPDRKVSFVIVGAGGFIGIGRHDVAIAVSQIQDRSGKLVLPGASKASIKALPEFLYATDTRRRDAFVAAADQDIADGKAKVTDLEKKADAAAADAKAGIDVQISVLRVDLQSAESRLTELRQASATRWREFEGSVSAATARLRKSIATATG